MDKVKTFEADSRGINALIYLMESHNLKQSDLPEIGSQGVVSEILNGKRKLNLRQIKELSNRFHVMLNRFSVQTLAFQQTRQCTMNTVGISGFGSNCE